MIAKGRLALFSATLGGGGAERVMATLANGFYREGYLVDVVLVKATGSYLNELDSGIQVVDLASSRAIFSLLPLIRYLRRTRPVAMLSTQGNVNIVAILARMMARVSLRLLVREASTPSVIARNQKGFKTWLTLKLLRVFYPLADCIIAPSQGVKDDLTQEFGLPTTRVVVLPNPLPLALIQQQAADPAEHPWFDRGAIPVILGIGRLSLQKDFPTLIGAFAKVVSRSACRLIILGEGEDRIALHNLVVSLGLRDQVAMPGFVDNPFSYLKRSAVYVLSSPSEGLPNTLLEALAVGTPAVATDCPSGPREILEEGRWGRLVPVADVDAMAEAINAALNGQVAIAPLSVLEDRYGVNQIVKKYLAVLTAQLAPCQPNNLETCNSIRIQFIITGLSIGGAEIMLLRLLERLDRTMFSPHVISLTDIGEIAPRIAALGIPVESLGMRRGVPNLFRFVRLVRRLRQIKPDVVHTWMYHADLMGGVAAWIAGVPKIIWGVHSSNFLHFDASLLTKLTVFWCARLSSWLPDCVQYVSHYGKVCHAELGYREHYSMIIPNGVDLDKFTPSKQARHDVRQELGIPSNTPLIGLIGRFDPLKNHEGFIRAAARLHRDIPEVHFLIVGQDIEWSNAVLKRFIDDAKLAQVFHLLGRRDDIARITASLDLASLTSWSEAFPNVLVEAMACGVPCVSTDAGDAAVILGDAGWIVPTGDMEGLAAQWAAFLTLPESDRRLVGERSRVRAMDQFELGAVVKRYEAMYHDVVKHECLIQKSSEKLNIEDR